MISFNPLYLLVIVPVLLTWLAQARVRNVYARYRQMPNRSRMSGMDAARYLLSHKGLAGVNVVPAEGSLADRYDPQTGTLHLSDEIMRDTSVTALGIVAHEVAHAVQHAEGYRFIRLRTTLAQPVTWVARLSPLVFVGGMLLRIPGLMAFGGLMLFSQAIFALVTLPVERNASTRAVAMLEETGLVVPAESKEVGQVLHGAAMTYLTALGRQVASFLFFVAAVAAARFAGHA